MQIEKILVLSTCHIAESTNNLLCSGMCTFSVDVRESGFFINTVMLSTVPVNKNESAIDITDCPEDLKECIRLAQEKGCDWLLLDRDGPVEDDLPVYDW